MDFSTIDFTPRYTRRAKWHNYRSRSIYMITITKNKGVPAFSVIGGTPHNPIVKLTDFGSAIDEELKSLHKKYGEFEIYKRVIMPDHIHFVLDVKKDTDYHLGTAIGWFKGACSRRCRELCQNEQLMVFAPNFHDRILTKKGQLSVMKRYVADNPRRFLIKKYNPDLFSCVNNISINGENYQTVGNIFLLREPLIEQVKVSRKFNDDQLKELDKRWKICISEGGVLISPFISPKEKDYRDLAIKAPFSKIC